MRPQADQAVLIVNPAARRVRKLDAGRIQRYLVRRGLQTELVVPDSAGAARVAARAASDAGVPLVFALGGDGTIRDVAAGLLHSATALAALPGGTVNIWCRETGIPTRIRAAVDAHLGGQDVQVDVGMAGDHAFLLMASAGWDADAAKHVSARVKRVVGPGAYPLAFLKRLPRLRRAAATWHSGVATEERQLSLIVIGNTRLYGGKVRFAPHATAIDGQLDVAAICPSSFWSGLRIGGRIAIDRIPGDGDVTSFRTPDLDLVTPGIPVQADGDYIGETPMRFMVEPKSLIVRVPAGPLAPILGGPEPRGRGIIGKWWRRQPFPTAERNGGG
ncbi:MAG: diacylglycerol kinase family protein [Dehalococcoidia bacterium]